MQKTSKPRTKKALAGRWVKLPGLGGSIRISGRGIRQAVEWKAPQRKTHPTKKTGAARQSTRRAGAGSTTRRRK